ncbi:hypothetical protein HPB47_023930 [Ixodes persulcatus]|uniref:Uncharacterized protein n=1 Tax=Ixodes persulcatus TaxID=34615 RepID=A0AC60Q5M4_IXOPE|nr:hypothetical protein HPB47_023930 [Ixodes persulcatus]
MASMAPRPAPHECKHVQPIPALQICDRALYDSVVELPGFRASLFSRASAVLDEVSTALIDRTAHGLHIVVFEEAIFLAGCRRFRENGVVAATRSYVVAYLARTGETKPYGYVNSAASLEANEKYVPLLGEGPKQTFCGASSICPLERRSTMEPSGFAEQLICLKASISRLRHSVNEELDNLGAALDTLAREQRAAEDRAAPKAPSEAHLRKKSSPGQDLPEKIFTIRESRIVDLMANEHLRTVFNIFVAFLFLVSVILVTSYFFDPQRLHDDISTIVLNSTGITAIFSYLVGINVSILFLVHPSIQLWAHCRTVTKSWLADIVFATLFLVYLGCCVVLPSSYVFVHELPPLSACIIAFEQVRLIMKVYGYVREMIGRVLTYAQLKAKSPENGQELVLPWHSSRALFPLCPYPHLQGLVPKSGSSKTFAQQTRFLPPLRCRLRRSKLPRTPKVRWGLVLWYLGQFLACFLLYSVVLNHFIKDLFRDAGKESFQLLGFTLTGCAIMLLGSISMFLVFYGFLHCWLNIFAEAMRFGDRLFYLDWWNSTTYGDFYRSWNLVVHDWLFNYVYRDAYRAFNRNKKYSMLVVFFLSAVVHEYILAVTYRFFFPVILVVFGTLGVAFVFITKKKTARFWNVFLWITLIAGWGLIVIFYTVEFYSRINCPQTRTDVVDFFIPRSFSWSCNAFSHSIWFPSSIYRQRTPVT